ncbi:MAG: hypothetical protein WC551_07715 [Patescibacteria group bacterium]
MTLPAIDSAAAWGADTWTDFEPIVDPTTELPASVAKTIAADTAAMTHTAVRAWVRFLCATYTSGTVACTVVDHDSVWGSATAPTVDEVAAGQYTITWPASVTDELGAIHTLAIRAPLQPALSGSATFGIGYAMVFSFTANVINLRTYNTSFTEADMAADYCTVAWY